MFHKTNRNRNRHRNQSRVSVNTPYQLSKGIQQHWPSKKCLLTLYISSSMCTRENTDDIEALLAYKKKYKMPITHRNFKKFHLGLETLVCCAVTCEELGRDVVKSVPESQSQNRLISRILQREVGDDLQVVGASRRCRCANKKVFQSNDIFPLAIKR